MIDVGDGHQTQVTNTTKQLSHYLVDLTPFQKILFYDR